ncbi:hypothetical protein GN157_09005 [Flavobacterium rakeshii]|uniref:PepSY domain-containing protein n=1 Tax=Flavobacterium rakeshii TaxID=1038845 RepID=A0A6N8HDN1_9FLAO|nr:hypothetical protein [Flavobacterium rakeshii]MUV03845.1 hypothetical protein [Flavobacterium rakeshii]
MISPEKAVEIVKDYLDRNKIDYIRVSEKVKTEKEKVPHGVMEGKELTSYTVAYYFEGYYGETPIFITLNAEDGALLYGISSSGFLDLT